MGYKAKLLRNSVAASLLFVGCDCFQVAPPNKPQNIPQTTTQIEAATALPLESSISFATEKEPNVGVLLLNLGGPETGDDVEGKPASVPSPRICYNPPILVKVKDLFISSNSLFLNSF